MKMGKEDEMIFEHISRQPTRRIFKIDVGNLPPGKAEDYIKEMIEKYRDKPVNDSEKKDI
jgi:hypothetical protein